jgi:hypothetical protein
MFICLLASFTQSLFINEDPTSPFTQESSSHQPPAPSDSPSPSFFETTGGIITLAAIAILILGIVAGIVYRRVHSGACNCCRFRRGKGGTDQYGQVIVNENDDLAYGLERV